MPASAWQSSAQKNISWIFESTPTALIWRGVDAHTIQPTLWPVPRRKLWYVWAEERSRFDSFLLRVPRRGVVMNEPRVRANNKKYPFKFFFHALRKVKEVIRWACTRWFACVDIQSKVIFTFESAAATRHMPECQILDSIRPTTFLLHISHDQRNEAKALECGRRYEALAGYGRRPRVGGLRIDERPCKRAERREALLFVYVLVRTSLLCASSSVRRPPAIHFKIIYLSAYPLSSSLKG